MRLNIATPFIAAAAVAPALTRGFHVASRPAATRASTSPAARRSMLSALRRSDPFFPDIDRLFDEVDEMMESSIAARSLRPSAAAPALSHGSRVASRPSATRKSTGLAARRSVFPMLRRSDFFSPDIDCLFDEMDEMMQSSLAANSARTPSSLLGRATLEGSKLRRPLGFEVVQDEKEYKMTVNVPGVEAKDIDLQVDRDGGVLRLKGNRTYEEGGMKIQSRFEKAILLSPDVDAAKLAANMLGDVLTVVAPKVEKEDVVDKAEDEKIEINAEEPEASLRDDVAPKIEKKDLFDKTKDKKIEFKVEEPKAALQDDVAPKIEQRDVVDRAKDKKIEIKVEESKAALQDDGLPKIEKKDVLDKAKDKRIEIKVEEPEAALKDDGEVAPKIEKKDMLDKAEDKKIEIKVEEPEAALQDDREPSDNTQSKTEKRWPVRDFPY